MSKRVLAAIVWGTMCTAAGAQVLETKTYEASGRPADGRMLLLTVFMSGEVMVLRMK